jgi:hypothetical protein
MVDAWFIYGGRGAMTSLALSTGESCQLLDSQSPIVDDSRVAVVWKNLLHSNRLDSLLTHDFVYSYT